MEKLSLDMIIAFKVFKSDSVITLNGLGMITLNRTTGVEVKEYIHNDHSQRQNPPHQAVQCNVEQEAS